MRAVMPGYVNFYYSNGAKPTHTKPFFNQSNVLTVQGIIVKNTLVFMNKVYYYPWLLPPSVRETIAVNAPRHGSTFESSQDWLSAYGCSSYNKSIFYKGPLLAIDPLCSESLTVADTVSVNAYKHGIKRMLLQSQKSGCHNDWESNKFLLYSITGLRRSSRLNECNNKLWKYGSDHDDNV